MILFTIHSGILNLTQTKEQVKAATYCLLIWHIDMLMSKLIIINPIGFIYHFSILYHIITNISYCKVWEKGICSFLVSQREGAAMVHQLLGVKKSMTSKGIPSHICKWLFPLAKVSERGKQSEWCDRKWPQQVRAQGRALWF